MAEALFDFEKPIQTLEKKLQDLRDLSQKDGVNLSDEILSLEKKLDQLIDNTYANLTPWQRVLISRHPNRPYTRDYIEGLFPEFMELHGDRTFGDDHAIMAGVAYWPPVLKGSPRKDPRIPILVIGQQKGRTTKQKVERNFGMAKPEGYRKVMRLCEMADRFKMPIVTLIDTPGAYPGIETEERGQAQAIAESIRLSFNLNVPVLTVVIGEGGSGGALAIGGGNVVLVQEFSYYSVISPEGCASILWSDATLAERASEVLKISAPDLVQLGVVDDIIPEPKGGAHRDWNKTFEYFKKSIEKHFNPYIYHHLQLTDSPLFGHLKKVIKKSVVARWTKVTDATKLKDFRSHRIEKFRKMGNHAIARTKGTSS